MAIRSTGVMKSESLTDMRSSYSGSPPLEESCYRHPMNDSFGSRATLRVGGRQVRLARLDALERRGLQVSRLPYALRILLENLLRREDGALVTAGEIEALASWDPKAVPSREIAFMPARVLLQDFTGVPAVVDLAAMRDAMVAMGGDPKRINPLQPVELVIDHSVQVDEYGSAAAFLINAGKELERNRERYAFLRWGQTAFANFRVVPPDTGIVHQVNLEYLARVVMEGEVGGELYAYPDTLVGTDSHTTMINGLGVLGWGVGGIEAEAAMLGQPVSMLIPQVVGFRLSGELPEGATATDLVLTVTEMLRRKGVVGKFVEFYGPGLANLPLADRATIGNMAPEYGATCGIFPVDQISLDYLAFSGRSPEQVALVEAYMKEQGLFHTKDSPEPEYSDSLSLDLGSVEPSLAGPRRPQDRVRLWDVKASFEKELAAMTAAGRTGKTRAAAAPGLPAVGGTLVGYGCTTCIGNSGPLPPAISKTIEERDLVAVAVLSGNRNFEGRINADVRANYLASPPLVVAYALAGRIDVDLRSEPLGTGSDGQPVYLKDVWPTRNEVAEPILRSLHSEMFRKEYADVFRGDEHWNGLDVPEGDTYAWDPGSTYVRQPPYFVDMPAEPRPVEDVHGARVLGVFGDSITTDHISPAGSIKVASPAGRYLVEHGVAPKDFNSYGARRGNHEVMVRGTFANIRIRNRMVPEIEGGFTVHLPDGEPLSIYDAAEKYQREGVPTVVLAGKEYGTGSSRDWAAKGPLLQGVRAVIAESFERIHRSNLVGMGIAPLEFIAGDSLESLGLTGHEVIDVSGIAAGVESRFAGGREVTVRARKEDGSVQEFKARLRLDTPQEVQYYRHGGILHYVLRQLLRG